MTPRFRSPLPGGISAQIAILLVVSVVAIHAIVWFGFWLGRNDGRTGPFGIGVGFARIATIASLLDGATTPQDRAAVVTSAKSAFPDIEIGKLALPKVDDDDDPLIAYLRRDLGSRFRAARIEGRLADGGAAQSPRFAIWLADGTSIAEVMQPAPMFMGPLSVTLLFIAISMTIIGWWVAHALTWPLRAFSRAAENFTLDVEPAPLPERGPKEIRTASRAMNHMRLRIKRLADDRTRMLAAVGHDLRTPITRLRLRSEFIPDMTARMQMLRDLDHMNAMVETAISFLRGERTLATMLDLPSILQTLCDRFADMGYDVTYDGPGHFTTIARPDDLTRAVANLMDNATRHGSHVVVRLILKSDMVIVEVEDDGAGIPDEEKVAMLKPFVRGDRDDTGGFGLGLSIAAAGAEAHGGELRMIDRHPHGLFVRIQWPPLTEAGPSA